MTSVVPLGQESRATGSFYAPRFEVKIEGVGLPRDVLRDVVQLTYHDSVAELDGFEMVVNNWDAATRSFKYVGSETDDDLAGNDPKAQRYKLFEPCGKDVTVRMGYRDDLVTMLTGTVTTMEPSFPTSGGPTLTVRGLNSLHQLRRKPYTYAWENKRDSEIAVALSSMTDDETHNKRFPMPVEIDTEAKGKEKPIPYIAQQNQTDIDFLFSRARERGYVMFILEETKLPNGTKRPRRLYFGPSQGGKGVVLRNVIFELRWGGSLTEFKPTLTTANQVRSVTVRGWDRAAKKPIEEKIDLDDAELNRNQDLYRLLKRCDPREDVVTNLPVFNKDDAKAKARALLQERSKIMVTASATTVGLPDLRAGQLVNIVGVGSRFSGTYFITDSTHTVGDSGYTTQFNCRRETQAQASGS